MRLLSSRLRWATFGCTCPSTLWLCAKWDDSSSIHDKQNMCLTLDHHQTTRNHNYGRSYHPVGERKAICFKLVPGETKYHRKTYRQDRGWTVGKYVELNPGGMIVASLNQRRNLFHRLQILQNLQHKIQYET